MVCSWIIFDTQIAARKLHLMRPASFDSWAELNSRFSGGTIPSSSQNCSKPLGSPLWLATVCPASCGPLK